MSLATIVRQMAHTDDPGVIAQSKVAAVWRGAAERFKHRALMLPLTKGLAVAALAIPCAMAGMYLGAGALLLEGALYGNKWIQEAKAEVTDVINTDMQAQFGVSWNRTGFALFPDEGSRISVIRMDQKAPSRFENEVREALRLEA